MTRRAARAALPLAAALLYPQSGFASCLSSGRPLCQLYENYSVVFDGTVVGVENIDLEESIRRKLGSIPHRVATFEVHRAWKGVSGDRVQLLLRGGWVGKDGPIVDVSEQLRLKRGDRYVMFGTKGPSGYVTASACSPTVPYHAAVQVLEFLYSLDRPPTGGVITGTVRTNWFPLKPGAAEAEPGVTRVRLSGMGVDRRIAIHDGRFELGGLPPGKYSVSVARPAGMKRSPPQTVSVATPRSCEHLFINNIPDTRINGVARLINGKPLEGVAILVDGATTAQTDRTGFFQVEGIAPGRYGVVKILRIGPNDVIRREIYEDGNKPLEVTVTIRKRASFGVLGFAPMFGVTLELELKPVDGTPLPRPALR